MPDVLAALDPEQRQAAAAVAGPVCILAGAGTGKTRAITHRIANMVLSHGVESGSILAVTFTTRAAGEMRGRLRGLGVSGVPARTFHSAALRQLQYFWPRISRGGRPTVVESKLPSVRAAATRLRLSLDVATQRDIAAEIEWAKAAQVGVDGYAAAARDRATPLDLPTMAKVYAGYEEVNTARNQLDFEDLLLLCAAAIEEHRDIAAEVRRQYRYFVVDEYQDVNALQQRLLDAWLGDREEVCVVGDPNQTIYTFAGASDRYLLGFASRYPQATVVRLRRDYRSTGQVVSVANRLLPRAGLVAQAGDGPEPTFRQFADEPAEASAVAERVQQLAAEGVQLREVAVLFRVNAQSAVYEAALASLDLPYQLRGAERFFDRPAVRQAVVLLRGAARAAADEPVEDLPAMVTEVLAGAGLSEQPPPGGAARERWESLRALVGLAEEYVAAGAEHTLGGFAAELVLRAETQHAPPVEGVTLSSLHAAKGLEWDAVFLVGLADGTVPITHAVTPEQVEEERRLLYVGVTRARRHLWLSWAEARAAGARRGRRRSRFLDPFGPVGPPRGADRGSRRTDRGRAEQAREELDGPAKELFDRLRSWRLETARGAGLPAFVVFDDRTLTAIATKRPSTHSALAAVSGVGQKKLDLYGEDVLRIVRG